MSSAYLSLRGPRRVEAQSVTLRVYTARVTYAGPDRLDITRVEVARLGEARAEGAPFAPSWAILSPMLDARRVGGESDELWTWYVEAYTEEMRRSARDHRPAWDRLLAQDERTLVCYCFPRRGALRCHRRVLAGILARCGASDAGER